MFRYQALDPASGRRRAGEIAAADPYAARAALRSVGLEALSLVAERPALRLPGGAGRWLEGFRRSRRRAQLADLFDALATLLGAGIPLEKALSDLCSSSVRGRDERRMLRALRDAIRDGAPLDQAAAAHPGWFDAMDVAMIAAGHRSGEMPAVLQDLARGHQRSAETGHRLVMALSYPALLLAASLAVVAFIGNSTLPQLLRILREAKVQEPLLTVAVAQAGQVLALWWWAILLALAGGAWWVSRWAASRDPGSRAGRLLMSLPLARARQRLRVAGIAGVLAQLLRNGVTLTQALETAAATTASAPLRALLMAGAEGVRRGEPLSATLGASALLDPEFAQLLRVAEQAGELPDICQRIAERYERAARRSLDRLAGIAEPAAILGMAVVVGLVVMAAVLPLIALGDVL